MTFNEFQKRSPLALSMGDIGKAEQSTVHRIVVHITGTSTHANALRHRQNSLHRLRDYFADLWMEAQKRGSAYSVFSQFGIGPWGEIGQFADCDKVPGSQSWGAKSAAPGGSAREARIRLERAWAKDLGKPHTEGKELRVPKWWLDYWVPTLGKKDIFKLVSPLDLLAPGETSFNYNSISIECIQWQESYDAWKKGKRNYLLTMAQYIALNALINDRLAAFGLQWTPSTVLGHEDANPWTRGDKGGRWDPGARRAQPRFCWSCAQTLDFTHGGKFKRCPCILADPLKRGWE